MSQFRTELVPRPAADGCPLWLPEIEPREPERGGVEVKVLCDLAITIPVGIPLPVHVVLLV